MKNDQPLLTIAIPTYNRAKILKIALEKLLPQVQPFSQIIEIVISNNASTDETEKVIDWAQENYKEINLIRFLHKENTGYFGNFWKCRELSSGKYFWLLSDNDHVEPKLIKEIMEILSKNDTISAIYLKKEKCYKYNDYKILQTTVQDLFLYDKKSFLTTLISNIIILNVKKYDEIIISENYGNNFLGFLFFLSAIRKNKIIVILKGPTFNVAKCYVYFDVFEAWGRDMNYCLSYIKKNKILNEKEINNFIDSYLKNVLRYHILNLLIFGEIEGRKYENIAKINKNLDHFYLQNNYYKKILRPFFNKNKTYLLICYYSIRVISKISKISEYLRILYKNELLL